MSFGSDEYLTSSLGKVRSNVHKTSNSIKSILRTKTDIDLIKNLYRFKKAGGSLLKLFGSGLISSFIASVCAISTFAIVFICFCLLLMPFSWICNEQVLNDPEAEAKKYVEVMTEIKKNYVTAFSTYDNDALKVLNKYIKTNYPFNGGGNKYGYVYVTDGVTRRINNSNYDADFAEDAVAINYMAISAVLDQYHKDEEEYTDPDFLAEMVNYLGEAGGLWGKFGENFLFRVSVDQLKSIFKYGLNSNVEYGSTVDGVWIKNKVIDEITPTLGEIDENTKTEPYKKKEKIDASTNGQIEQETVYDKAVKFKGSVSIDIAVREHLDFMEKEYNQAVLKMVKEDIAGEIEAHNESVKANATTNNLSSNSHGNGQLSLDGTKDTIIKKDSEKPYEIDVEKVKNADSISDLQSTLSGNDYLYNLVTVKQTAAEAEIQQQYADMRETIIEEVKELKSLGYDLSSKVPTGYAGNSPEAVEKAIQWAIDIANDDSHGYCWAHRTMDEFDCSSLVLRALRDGGGFNISSIGSTHNMIDIVTASDPHWKWIPRSELGDMSEYTISRNGGHLKRGDILLNIQSHTELYLGNNKSVGAHANYSGSDSCYCNGSNYDRTDPSGKEICVDNYWYDHWDGVLRYVPDETDDD